MPIFHVVLVSSSVSISDIVRRTKGRMPFCKKLLTARDKKQKLAGKFLTEHSRRKHGAEKEVGAALMLNEIQRDDNPTASQRITKYTKCLSHEDRVNDRYPSGGTNIACSDPDYEQGDSDLEFAAEYCA